MSDPSPVELERLKPVLREDTTLERLRRLGEFELLREIGRGGMGAVYEAWQPSLGRRAAVKVIQAWARLEPEAVERFRREAHAMAQCAHPNVVAIYAAATEGAFAYYAMELVDGPTVAQALKAGPVEPGRAAEWARQVALALEHLDGRGLVHRDVKPENLFVTSGAGREVVKLGDFGLVTGREFARRTLEGHVLGTPAYLAPEQARGGRRIDHRADVYALGVCLYEMLTLRLPFEATDVAALLRQIEEKEPPPPSRHARGLPRDLETVVLKCLEKDAARRYASARGLREDLERFLAGEPVAARRPSVAERARRFSRRHRPAILATLALVLVLGVLGVRRYVRRTEQSHLLRAEAETLHLELESVRRRLGAFERHASESWGLWADAESRSEADRRLDESPEFLRRWLDSASRALEEARRLRPSILDLQVRYQRLIGRWRDVSCAFDPRAESLDLMALRLRLAERSMETERKETIAALLSLRAGQGGLPREPLGPVRITFHLRPGATALLWTGARVSGRGPPPLTGAGETFTFDVRPGLYGLQVRLPGATGTWYPFVVERWGPVQFSLEFPSEAAAPDGFEYVPGGWSVMGAFRPLEGAALTHPRDYSRWAFVASLWIQTTETTIGEFREFTDRCRPELAAEFAGDPDLPVCGVSCTIVREYAAWRSDRDGRRYRLPTADEWERAAAGVGGTWSQPMIPRDSRRGAGPFPAGSSASDVSVFGVRDLAGNVAEMTSSRFAPGTDLVEVKGSSFSDPAPVPLSARRAIHEDESVGWVGFRLVVEADPPR